MNTAFQNLDKKHYLPHARFGCWTLSLLKPSIVEFSWSQRGRCREATKLHFELTRLMLFTKKVISQCVYIVLTDHTCICSVACVKKTLLAYCVYLLRVSISDKVTWPLSSNCKQLYMRNKKESLLSMTVIRDGTEKDVILGCRTQPIGIPKLPLLRLDRDSLK